MNLTQVVHELFQLKTYKNLKKHYLILWFYFLVIFVTSTVGYVMDKQNGFTHGMIVGFIVSLILWNQYGRSMVY